MKTPTHKGFKKSQSMKAAQMGIKPKAAPSAAPMMQPAKSMPVTGALPMRGPKGMC